MTSIISNKIRISNVPLENNEDIYLKISVIVNAQDFVIRKEILDCIYISEYMSKEYLVPICKAKII